MLSKSLLVVVVVVSLVVNSAPGQEEQCAPFESLLDAAQYYCERNFPPTILNESCLLSSCPSLSGVCPITSTGCVDPIALTTAVSILNTCIGQDRLICGYNMSHSPMAPISYTTATFLPPTVANGTLVLVTGFLQNFCQATFSVQQNAKDPIALTVGAQNFYGEAYYNIAFDFPQTSILHGLRGLIPDSSFFNSPYTKCVLHINVTSAVAIDPKTLAVKTVEEQFELHIVFSDFVNADGDCLSQEVVDLFNEGFNKFLKMSVIPKAIIDFLSAYAAKGLRAAQLNCPEEE